MQRTSDHRTLSLGAGWRGRAWSTGAHYQDLWLTGRYRTRSWMGLGPALSLSGSPEGRWVEASPSIALGRDNRVVARLGPVARVGQGVAPTGLRGGGAITARGAAGRRLDAQASATLWGHPDLPLVDLQGRLTTTSPLASRSSVQLLLHGAAGLGDQTENPGWIAGVAPAGRSLAGVGLAGERTLGARTRLRVELLGERAFGVLPQSRVTLLVGLTGARARLSHPGRVPSPALHHFTLLAPTAKSVSLAGSFNGWLPEPLSRSPDGVWTLERILPVGVHTYVYLVDGEALVPPEATRTEPDGFGGTNGVLVVGAAGDPQP